MLVPKQKAAGCPACYKATAEDMGDEAGTGARPVREEALE